MFQLGKTPLMVVTPEVQAEVEKYYDTSMFVPWLRRSFPGFGTLGLAYPTGLRDCWIDYRVCKLNRFYWPTGASRWAFGHFLVGADQIDSIRFEAYDEDELGMNELPLVISCPGQRSPEVLSTKVFVLACTPVGGMTGYNNVNPPYIVTVADDRYWWYYKSTGLLAITDTTTWASLFSQLQTSLGVTINLDTINSAYLNPSTGFNVSYEYLPVVLDAACMNIGHRLIRSYDGTVYTQAFGTALTALQNDFEDFPMRTVRSGGSRYLDIS